MAPDIFNRTDNQLGDVFRAEDAKLTMANNLSTMVQGLQIQYQQAVSRIYELGSKNMYFISGRTQGQATLNRIIGPRRVVKYFYTLYGNVCEPKPIEFSLDAPGCLAGGLTKQDKAETKVVSFISPRLFGSPTSILYRLENAVLTGVGVSMTAQDMIINENSTMMFTHMSVR